MCWMVVTEISDLLPCHPFETPTFLSFFAIPFGQFSRAGRRAVNLFSSPVLTSETKVHDDTGDEANAGEAEGHALAGNVTRRVLSTVDLGCNDAT